MLNRIYDLVLLHPGGENMLGLQGPFFPIGWLGIASFLKKHRYNVKIINCFLEKLLDPSISLRQLISRYSSYVYGIDLHWFIHSFEAIALAKKVKEAQPESKIVLGGLTSSIFVEEILREFDFIDCIVKGEGEIPLLRYIEAIKKKAKNFDSVPNISYKNASRIVHNQIEHVASRQDLDELDFLDFSCVLNFKKLFTLRNADYTINAPSSSNPKRYLPNKNTFTKWPVYTGRGCRYNCSFCGGSKSAFKVAHNRSCLTLRSPERIADDVIRLNKMGIQNIYFPHSPLTTNSEFNKKILAHIRKSDLKLNCGFFFEDVPFVLDFDILKGYMELFDINKSVIRVYAVDYDASVRDKNNFKLSWESIQELHKFCKDLPVIIQTAVLVGLPGQNKTTCERLAKELKKLEKHHYFPIIYTAEMHPGSLLHRKPSTFAISQNIVTFYDFYTHLHERTNKAMFLGYNSNSECSAQEQKRIIEETLHYDLKVVCIDFKVEDRVLADSTNGIHKNRSKTCECIKMITEAHAVKARRIVFCVESILGVSKLCSMFNVCKALNLAITVRIRARYLVDPAFVQKLCHKLHIMWELFIYNGGFVDEDNVDKRDGFSQAIKGINNLLSFDQKIRGYIVTNDADDDWLHILNIFKSLGIEESNVVIDDQATELSIEA